MNTWQLNGQLLGKGVSDPRVLLSATNTAYATSTAALHARRYLVSTISAVASVTSRLDGVFRVTAALIGRASSVVTVGAYFAKYISTSVTAQATSVAPLVAFRGVSSSITILATAVSVLWRGRALAGTATPSAASSVDITELGFDAPPSRVTKVPLQNRTMKVG